MTVRATDRASTCFYTSRAVRQSLALCVGERFDLLSRPTVIVALLRATPMHLFSVSPLETVRNSNSPLTGHCLHGPGRPTKSKAKRGAWFCFYLTAFCAAPLIAGAARVDLERLKPVPPTEVIPVVDFFRPPLFSRPALNMSGTHFAAVVDNGLDHTALLVCELEKMQTKVLRGSSKKDLASLAWLDETHILTSWIDEKLYAGGLYVTDAGDVKINYPIEDLSVTELVGVPTTDRMKPLIWVRRNAYDDGRDMGVVQLDARRRLPNIRDMAVGSFEYNDAIDAGARYGTAASIVRSFPAPSGHGVVIDYLADKDGGMAFAIQVESGVQTLLRVEGTKWLKCPVDLDDVYPVGVGDRPNELVVVGPRQEGKPRALCRLDAMTGQLGEVLVQDSAYDPTTAVLYRHPVSNVVLGVRFGRSMYESIWFDKNYQAVQKMLEANFPSKGIEIIGSDREEKRFFVRTYSDRQPVIYYSLNLANHSVGLVKNSSPWIDESRMRPMNIVRLKSRDSHQIEAYLTMPDGASKQNPPPLVVLPHGGPWARDSWGFDGEVQFLVSRGYAVLQPNYRASSGYNWMYPESDQWAFRKMHDDVTDCVKKLVSSGLVDASRIAIMGSSFGAYLAACGAAFEPDLYRCSVVISGVFDWGQVMREAKFDQYAGARFGILQRYLGDPEKKREEFEAISPLRHLDQVKIPFFVAHGKDDQVAEVTESRALIAGLKKHQISCEAMLVSGEGHGMQYLTNEVELYSRIEAFLAENMRQR